MAEPLHLTGRMAGQLPAELAQFLHLAGEVARRQGKKLYLVGGVVRDLLLGRENFDIDLVVERDALAVAQELAQANGARLTLHQRFGTARLDWDGWSADLASARSEMYPEPCVLPVVAPGSIGDDLFRRDFTINAMAVELDPERYGILLDPYGGLVDLAARLVRVLHRKSFIDDATRIWRGLRYEQRLGFQLETDTLELLRRDAKYLRLLSGDRVRHELELVFREARPGKVLRRAGELGVLACLHPSLNGRGLEGKLRRARRLCAPGRPSLGLYLALLLYRLKREEAEKVISYLHLRKATARVVRDALTLRDSLEPLSIPEWTPGEVYAYLISYDPEAVKANLAACRPAMVRERLEVFLRSLRHVRPVLDGEELKRMGVPQGPEMKVVLDRLLEARLEGTVSDPEDERELVARWLTEAKR